MGMNYFADFDLCPHCGEANERILIGKSSAGWCFSLHAYTPPGTDRRLDTPGAWVRFIMENDAVIRTENGVTVDVGALVDVITCRVARPGYVRPFPFTQDFLEQNHAIEGPNGLLRPKLRGDVIAHGAGTWDLIRNGPPNGW